MAYRMKDITWTPGETEGTIATLPKDIQAYIINEISLSKIDFNYWFRRYAKFLDDRKNLTVVTPWPSQQVVLDRLSKLEDEGLNKLKIIVLKARQVGETALWEALIAHLVCLNPNTAGIIASDHPDNSLKLWQVMMRLYDNLPGWMQPRRDAKVKAINLHLDQIDSDVQVASGNQKTTIGQGMTVDAAHLTEVSTWERENAFRIDADMIPAFDSSQKHHSIFGLESTGAGGTGNWFHDEWKSAVDGTSEFSPIFVAWYMRPNRNESAEGVEFNEKTLNMAERVKREVGVELTKEQLAWYQKKRISAEAKNQLEIFFQEYASCLSDSTLVSTERGIIPIVSAQGVKRTESGEVEHLIEQKPSPVVEMVTKAGRRLRGTPEHPIHTPENTWIPLGQLKEGDRISLCPPMFAEQLYKHQWKPFPFTSEEITFTPALGRFLGYFMGDGSYRNGILSFCVDAKDPEVAVDMKRVCEELFNRNLSITKRGNFIEVRGGTKRLAPVFNDLGIITSLKGKRKVCVPAGIFRSPKEVIREFIRALFECDGSASTKTGVRFGSKHLEFIEHIQLLLLGFGITSRIVNNFRTLRGITHPFYALYLRREESLKFFSEIGFISKRKSSYTPRTRRTLAGRSAMPIEFIDEVKSVTPMGIERTWDFTIRDQHAFSANGILTHNTPTEAFQTGFRSIFPIEIVDKVRNSCKQPIGVFEVLPEKRKLRQANLNNWLADPSLLKAQDKLLLWENPRPGCIYVVSADASYGMEGKDNAAVQVLRVGNRSLPDEQVAEWCGTLSPSDLVAPIWILGHMFMDKYLQLPAQVAVECNPGSPGIVTQLDLMKAGYPNFYVWQRPLRQDGAFSNEVGWWTTPSTRTPLVDGGVEGIKKGDLIINSAGLTDEMRSFVLTFTPGGQRKVEHAPGMHDDRLMSLFIAYYVAHCSDNLNMAEERHKQEALKLAPKRPKKQFWELAASWKPGDSMETEMEKWENQVGLND